MLRLSTDYINTLFQCLRLEMAIHITKY